MNIFSQENFNGVQQVINAGGAQQVQPMKNQTVRDEVSDLNSQTQHIQELIEEIELIPDQKTRQLAQECIQEMLGFYGYGLKKILHVISSGNSSAAKDIYNGLIEDSFINGLLLIHDLHPLDLKTRLYQALEKVKPYMDSHGGSVEVVRLENGVAKLKLSGSCKGCPSSGTTLELGIKQAIEENCPDLLGLEVEGVSQTDKTKHTGQKISYEGWKTISGLNNMMTGAMKAVELSGLQLVFFQLKEQLYAYRNECPACGTALDAGTLEANLVSCKLGHRYDIQLAGRCTDDPALHLDPFPLLHENGQVKVAIG